MLLKNLKSLIKITIILLLISSCSSIVLNDNMNKNSILEDIKSVDSNYESIRTLLYVDIESQSLLHIEKGTVLKVYSISSSAYGTGSKENSFKTPLGKHEIYKKLGTNLPTNAILKGRVWNGAIADIIKEPIDTDFDHVTSRIMWLDGLEEGLNKGEGVDSRKRFIYIHGTAEEGLIGKPASMGCIRMFNDDVIRLTNLVKKGTKVDITI